MKRKKNVFPIQIVKYKKATTKEAKRMSVEKKKQITLKHKVIFLFFQSQQKYYKKYKVALFFFINYCLQNRSTNKAASQQNATKILQNQKKWKPNHRRKTNMKNKRKHSKKIKVSIYCDIKIFFYCFFFSIFLGHIHMPYNYMKYWE